MKADMNETEGDFSQILAERESKHNNKHQHQCSKHLVRLCKCSSSSNTHKHIWVNMICVSTQNRLTVFLAVSLCTDPLDENESNQIPAG